MANDPGSWNRYSYTRGDPVNRVDPSGQIDCWSYYLYLTNTGFTDPDSLLGNCEGQQGETGSELDPCSQLAEEFGFSDDANCNDGDGSSEYAMIQPTLLAGGKYSISQTAAITNGFNAAIGYLDNPKCADLFVTEGTPDFATATAVEQLENTTYGVTSMKPGVAAVTENSTWVELASNGAFFNSAPNANGTVSETGPNSNGKDTTFTFASTTVLQAFILLHELGHQMGVLPPDANKAINGANSAAVLQDCFTKVNGVYQ